MRRDPFQKVVVRELIEHDMFQADPIRNRFKLVP
ncbi:hypothetical protein EST38_g2766 [Candolleomyces aberdarensis]|uniref:Uncharacterized protein n=1 Tax=Candolleomyces aberdarensis TaxID=2316362 RepID=A0A4V1Q4S2_9AGAR|nr:hypothetical protein EST38_g2766 [Candolleomyces aberdarensis]